MRIGFHILHLAAAAYMIAAPLHAEAGEEKPAFSIKTPIEQIVANPDAKAVLERALPGFTTLPQYDQLKTMSLETLVAMFPDAVPNEQVEAIDVALRAIPAPASEELSQDAAPAASESVPNDPQ